jgi:hypothetical protein
VKRPGLNLERNVIRRRSGNGWVTASHPVFAALLLAFTTFGCEVGQDGPVVSIHNATDIKVFVLRPTWSRSSLDLEGWYIEPGETLNDRWQSALRSARLKMTALDPSNRFDPIWCRVYTYGELMQLKWRVDIVKGEISC